MSERLTRELSLLYAAEFHHEIPAAPIVRQLVADEQRGLPDGRVTACAGVGDV